jgi:hypothetical protein
VASGEAFQNLYPVAVPDQTEKPKNDFGDRRVRVYAGGVPDVLLKYLKTIAGKGATAQILLDDGSGRPCCCDVPRSLPHTLLLNARFRFF